MLQPPAPPHHEMKISVSPKSIAAASSKRSGLLLPSPAPPSLARRSDGGLFRLVSASYSSFSSLGSSPLPSSGAAPPFSANQATSDVENILAKGRKRVEDVMPIATGHEREELEAELEGKKRSDIDAPTGPFGTKKMVGSEASRWCRSCWRVSHLFMCFG